MNIQSELQSLADEIHQRADALADPKLRVVARRADQLVGMVQSKPRRPSRTRKIASHSKRKWTDAETAQAVELARQGKSGIEIGRALGRTPGSIQNQLRRVLRPENFRAWFDGANS